MGAKTRLVGSPRPPRLWLAGEGALARTPYGRKVTSLVPKRKAVRRGRDTSDCDLVFLGVFPLPGLEMIFRQKRPRKEVKKSYDVLFGRNGLLVGLRDGILSNSTCRHPLWNRGPGFKLAVRFSPKYRGDQRKGCPRAGRTGNPPASSESLNKRGERGSPAEKRLNHNQQPPLRHRISHFPTSMLMRGCWRGNRGPGRGRSMNRTRGGK